MKKIALIVHADEYFRIALKAILRQMHGFTDIEERSRPGDIATMLKLHGQNFELITIDEDFISPDQVRKIWADKPSLKIVVIAHPGTASLGKEFLDARAMGYLSRKESARSLSTKIGFILRGETSISHFSAQDADTETDDRAAEIERRLEEYNLPPRQLDVWRLLTDGKPAKIIARDLDISEGTVKIHLKALYKNLGVANGKAAAALGAVVFK